MYFTEVLKLLNLMIFFSLNFKYTVLGLIVAPESSAHIYSIFQLYKHSFDRVYIERRRNAQYKMTRLRFIFLFQLRKRRQPALIHLSSLKIIYQAIEIV